MTLNANTAWLVLLAAGVCETVWVLAMKASHGFTRLYPSLLTILAMAVSVLLLAWALKTLPVGTAYAVWTGLGAAGAAILGMVLFNEPASAARLFFLGLLLAGIVGLKLTS